MSPTNNTVYVNYSEYTPTPILKKDDEEAIKRTCMYIGSFAKPDELQYKVKHIAEPATQFDLSQVNSLLSKYAKSIIAETQQTKPPQKKTQWFQAGYKLEKVCFDYQSTKGCHRSTCRYQHIVKENSNGNQHSMKNGYNHRTDQHRFSPYQ